MRVGILALLHESNTFVDEPTRLEHFESNLLVTGKAVRDRLAETHHEVGGFFQGLDERGIEAVPIFAARAMPYGTVTADAFSRLVDRLLAELGRAGRLDGLLVAPHGATVSERHRDADGYWLTRVRQAVGDELPIVGTCDPHANLSPRMVDACDALVAYRSNPHLDQRQRGVEAARLLVDTLRHDIHPVMAASFPPLAINIERQMTSEPHLRPVYSLADEQLRRAGMLSNSILLGFPYADVPEMGSAAIAVADGDAQVAAEAARELGAYLWQRRYEFVGQMVDVEQALDRATRGVGPICLLDMGDNVGGGSPADGTVLAHGLVARGVRSFVCLNDPSAAAEAARLGVGCLLRMPLGGKTDARHGPPLEGEFRIEKIADGKFREPEPRHGGFTDCDQGRTAIVRHASGLTVMLTSDRMPPFSLRQLTSCGLEPGEFQVLVAKGVNAPVAAYAPVCRELIRVNTPGCTTADMESLVFEQRRRPMFPFERNTPWVPCAYARGRPST